MGTPKNYCINITILSKEACDIFPHEIFCSRIFNFIVFYKRYPHRASFLGNCNFITSNLS